MRCLIKEAVSWLKAESRKCPFCHTVFETTEFRRGIDEATNRTSEPSGQSREYQDKD
jgi:sarcosine oxidase delta subunit